MSSPNSLSIVIPTFNEPALLQTVESYLLTFSNSPLQFEIIVVDDGSAPQYTTDFGYFSTLTNVRLISRSRNKGYGFSVQEGVSCATYNDILITDSDLTYDSKCALKLAHQYFTSEVSMIIGARLGKDAHIPILRRPAKFFLRKLASILCQSNIQDVNSGLRIFNRSQFNTFLQLYPDRFSLSSTMTIMYTLFNYSVVYTPIAYARRAGSSKIHPFKDTLRFLSLTLKLVALGKTYRLFMPVSALFFLLFLIILFYRLQGVEFGSIVGLTSFLVFANLFTASILSYISNFMLRLLIERPNQTN